MFPPSEILKKPVSLERFAELLVQPPPIAALFGFREKLAEFFGRIAGRLLIRLLLSAFRCRLSVPGKFIGVGVPISSGVL